MYNKRQYRKANDKKVLHKVKKQWVTISLALFMAIGGGAVATSVNASANSTNNQNKPKVVAQLKPKQSKLDSSQAITTQAKVMHQHLLSNATVKNHKHQNKKINASNNPVKHINNINQLKTNQAGYRKGIIYNRINTPFNRVRVTHHILLHSNINSIGHYRNILYNLYPGNVIRISKAFKDYTIKGHGIPVRYEVPLYNKRNAFITSSNHFVSYVAPTSNYRYYRNKINHILKHSHNKKFSNIRKSINKLVKRENRNYRKYMNLYVEAYNTQQALRHPVVTNLNRKRNHKINKRVKKNYKANKHVINNGSNQNQSDEVKQLETPNSNANVPASSAANNSFAPASASVPSNNNSVNPAAFVPNIPSIPSIIPSDNGGNVVPPASSSNNNGGNNTPASNNSGSSASSSNNNVPNKPNSNSNNSSASSSNNQPNKPSSNSTSSSNNNQPNKPSNSNSNNSNSASNSNKSNSSSSNNTPNKPNSSASNSNNNKPSSNNGKSGSSSASSNNVKPNKPSSSASSSNNNTPKKPASNSNNNNKQPNSNSNNSNSSSSSNSSDNSSAEISNDLTQMKSEVLTDIDADRSKYHKAPLSENNDLDKIANMRGQQLTKVFSHTNKSDGSGTVLYPIDAQKLGINMNGRTEENIGYMFPGFLASNTGNQVADTIDHGMMYSDADSNWGHRDNILNSDVHQIGIGTSYDGKGNFYIAEDFDTNTSHNNGGNTPNNPNKPSSNSSSDITSASNAVKSASNAVSSASASANSANSKFNSVNSRDSSGDNAYKSASQSYNFASNAYNSASNALNSASKANNSSAKNTAQNAENIARNSENNYKNNMNTNSSAYNAYNSASNSASNANSALNSANSADSSANSVESSINNKYHSSANNNKSNSSSNSNHSNSSDSSSSSNGHNIKSNSNNSSSSNSSNSQPNKSNSNNSSGSSNNNKPSNNIKTGNYDGLNYKVNGNSVEFTNGTVSDSDSDSDDSEYFLKHAPFNIKYATNIKFDSDIDISNVSDMGLMFASDNNLQTLTLSNSFNTSHVTDMDFMFANDNNLRELILPNSFNTSHVTDMGNMFSGDMNLQTLKLPNSFNTNKVTLMMDMFSKDNNLKKLILPNSFITNNVTDMSNMFSGDMNLQKLALPSSFNTSKVTDMSNMFSSDYLLQSLTLPSSFDTSKVTNMGDMFSGDVNLRELILPNSFNTSEVTNMYDMFGDDSDLQKLTLPSSFNTSKVINMEYMFNNNKNLHTLTLPQSFNTNNVLKIYGMFQNVPLHSLTINSSNTKIQKMKWPSNSDSDSNDDYPSDINNPFLPTMYKLLSNGQVLSTPNNFADGNIGTFVTKNSSSNSSDNTPNKGNGENNQPSDMNNPNTSVKPSDIIKHNMNYIADHINRGTYKGHSDVRSRYLDNMAKDVANTNPTYVPLGSSDIASDSYLNNLKKICSVEKEHKYQFLTEKAHVIKNSDGAIGGDHTTYRNCAPGIDLGNAKDGFGNEVSDATILPNGMDSTSDTKVIPSYDGSATYGTGTFNQNFFASIGHSSVLPFYTYPGQEVNDDDISFDRYILYIHNLKAMCTGINVVNISAPSNAENMSNTALNNYYVHMLSRKGSNIDARDMYGDGGTIGYDRIFGTYIMPAKGGINAVIIDSSIPKYKIKNSNIDIAKNHGLITTSTVLAKTIYLPKSTFVKKVADTIESVVSLAKTDKDVENSTNIISKDISNNGGVKPFFNNMFKAIKKGIQYIKNIDTKDTKDTKDIKDISHYAHDFMELFTGNYDFGEDSINLWSAVENYLSTQVWTLHWYLNPKMNILSDNMGDTHYILHPVNSDWVVSGSMYRKLVDLYSNTINDITGTDIDFIADDLTGGFLSLAEIFPSIQDLANHVEDSAGSMATPNNMLLTDYRYSIDAIYSDNKSYYTKSGFELTTGIDRALKEVVPINVLNKLYSEAKKELSSYTDISKY